MKALEALALKASCLAIAAALPVACLAMLALYLIGRAVAALGRLLAAITSEIGIASLLGSAILANVGFTVLGMKLIALGRLLPASEPLGERLDRLGHALIDHDPGRS